MQGIVIGISLGKRATGVAILHEKKLVDWNVHTKNTAALTAIHSAISEHTVKVLAILKCREDANPLLSDIQALADANHVLIRYYSTHELKTTIHPCQHSNKRMLFLYLTELYSELITPYHKYLRQSNTYWQKVFEAIACATAV